MTVLTADDVGERHSYLAKARPDWRGTMTRIRRQGGPWACGTCDAASLLCYRCSVCGADLTGAASSQSG